MRFDTPWCTRPCGSRVAFFSLFLFLLLLSYLPRLQSDLLQPETHGRQTLSVVEDIEGRDSERKASSPVEPVPLLTELLEEDDDDDDGGGGGGVDIAPPSSSPIESVPLLTEEELDDDHVVVEVDVDVDITPSPAPPAPTIPALESVPSSLPPPSSDPAADERPGEEEEDQNVTEACRSDYMNVVLDPTKAQLNELQRTWIATTMQSYSAAAAGPINVLIWGLGHDSRMWYSVHCSNIEEVGGKIHFLEDNIEWVNKITEEYPQLQDNAFYFPRENFETDLQGAMKFLQHPRETLKLPEGIQEECWDIVLVDAPPGYGKHSGRHEAAYWSVEMAKRCLKQGHPRDIVIFLHDVQRKVEDAIFKKLLKPAGVELGMVRGEAGNLKAVRISTPR